MKRLLKEPLLHFLLIGAALFGVYFVLARNKAESPDDIVVTGGQIETLITSFTRVWQRPPTEAELKDLIDNHVTDEILSREAMKLGLDQNDTIIRRRLRQKMEFLAEDFAATAEPTNAELETYLREHSDAFRAPPKFTFRHVYLSDERGERLEADAAALLAQLKAEPSRDTSELGDVFLGPSALTDESWQSVASQFGVAFPEQLSKVAIGEWVGPIRSGYGSHLVRVTARSEGRQLSLDEARDLVNRELLADRRQRAKQEFLFGLLARYDVKIDLPPARGSAPDSGVQSKSASLAK